MTDVYRIANWDELFEVSDGNHPWKDGQKKRAGPIPYVRIQNRGAKWRRGYRNLLRLAEGDGAAVYGVYVKLVEIAGDQTAEYRGGIWIEPGIPATLEEIAEQLTGFSEDSVRKALEVLVHKDVGWLTVTHVQEISGNSRNELELPGSLLEVKTSKVKTSKDKVKSYTNKIQKGVTAQSIIDAWNEMAEPLGVATVLKLGKTRGRMMGDRLKEPFFCDHWLKAIEAVPHLPDFWLGRERGKKYKITFLYFVRPDSVASILENSEAAQKVALDPGMESQGEQYLGEDE